MKNKLISCVDINRINVNESSEFILTIESNDVLLPTGKSSVNVHHNGLGQSYILENNITSSESRVLTQNRRYASRAVVRFV